MYPESPAQMSCILPVCLLFMSEFNDLQLMQNKKCISRLLKTWTEATESHFRVTNQNVSHAKGLFVIYSRDCIETY